MVWHRHSCVWLSPTRDRSHHETPRENPWMGISGYDGTFYRRNLPHIVKENRLLFVTFSTCNRWRLPPGARTIALQHALHDHPTKIAMDVAVIMPDHVHLIFTLLGGHMDRAVTLASVMKPMKGISARRINQLLHRSGPVWQDESFDHVIRSTERSRAKFEYVCNNPVGAGLAASPDEYPWLWRSWVEGRCYKW